MRTLLMIIATILALPTGVYAQGSFVVRVENPAGSHCIDATKEAVTIHVRRVFTQKKEDFFTEDKRAGVVLTAQLIGRKEDQPNINVKLPSVNLVSIKDEPEGRVSLALEYSVADYLPLKNKDGVVTTTMQLSLLAAKKRGKNTFGQILDIAGEALKKLPIPANPYTDAASKILEFTNKTIDASVAEQQNLPVGEISLAFNRGPQPNMEKCKANGKERTGAFAVLLSTGIAGSELIPSTNTEQLYCFTYNSSATYELRAAKRMSTGACPANQGAYKGVNNDYTMFLMSAEENIDVFLMNSAQRKKRNESLERCKAFGLPSEACGVRSAKPKRRFN